MRSSDDIPTAPDVLLPDQEDFWRPPRRFGNVPVEVEPLGWDRNSKFEKHYPRVRLPMQIIERVSFGRSDKHEPNRLIWGDNLHVMRQLESNSIDLIYIDPPFFSGRQYNVMWGDNHEMRSFNDIWEDGMQGYLIWLNARLYEMKRLLKPTGSIYVHCDWHASHYIKVEMDKIFGYENFRNEIVWLRRQERHNLGNRQMGRSHDSIFWYAMSGDTRYNIQFLPYSEEYISKVYSNFDKRGRYTTFPCTNESGGNKVYDFMGISRAWRFSRDRMQEMYDNDMLVQNRPSSPFRYKKYLDESKGVKVQDLWDDIGGARGSESIGYPTQKPEALLERIIRASSNEGDVVADFVMGGGTSVAIAQKLGRRWIGCDQSRVAVAVTAERVKQQALTRSLEDADELPDFTIEHWGIYEANRLSQMSPDAFRDFVLYAYGVTRIGNADDAPHIHGWHNRRPVWVGESALDSQVTADDVRNFANAIRHTPLYQDSNLRDGTMLAWGFHPDARTAADRLKQQESIDLDFVRLAQIRIGDPEFREHIVGRSTERADYSEFLTFVQPPVVEVAYRALGGGSVTFDAGDTVVINSDAHIINIQWDFNHRDRFEATPGYSFKRDRNRKPELRVTHKFSRVGRFKVACRVQDSKGGEGVSVIEVEVK